MANKYKAIVKITLPIPVTILVEINNVLESALGKKTYSKANWMVGKDEIVIPGLNEEKLQRLSKIRETYKHINSISFERE